MGMAAGRPAASRAAFSLTSRSPHKLPRAQLPPVLAVCHATGLPKEGGLEVPELLPEARVGTDEVLARPGSLGALEQMSHT